MLIKTSQISVVLEQKTLKGRHNQVADFLVYLFKVYIILVHYFDLSQRVQPAFARKAQKNIITLVTSKFSVFLYYTMHVLYI